MHDLFRYSGDDPEDVIGIADSQAIDQMLKTGGRIWDNFYTLDESLEELVSRARAIRVKCESNNAIRICKLLQAARRLEYLDLTPCMFEHFASTIKTIDSLKTLSFTSSGRVVVSEGDIFPQVERLLSIGSSIRFQSCSFPRLLHMYIDDNPKGWLGRLLSDYSELETLMLSPCRMETALAAPVSVKYLRLINGRIENLDWLARFKNLTNLHIQNLPAVRSIAVLKQLEKLEEISIAYCGNIKDAQLLRKIKTLKGMRFFGCGSVDLSWLDH